MEDLLETPEDYGCYIVDRRGQGVEESVNELVSLLSFSLLSSPLLSSPLLSLHQHTFFGMVAFIGTTTPYPPSPTPPPAYGLPYSRPRLRVLMTDQPTPLLRQQVPTTTYQPAKPN